MGDPGDFFILFCDPLLGIDHQQADVAAFDRCHRTEHAEFFNIFIDLALSSYPRRVDEQILLAVFFKRGIDRVSGRPCDRRNDDTVFSQKPVHQRRFPHIWFPDHSNLDGIIFLRSCSFRETVHDLIQKISQIQHVGCGNRDRFPESQLIKIIKIIRQLRFIDLVDSQNDFFARFHQHGSDFPVCCRDPFLAVHHKQDHIGGIHGHFCLVTHLRKDDVLAVRLDTARIDQCKMDPLPLRFRVYPVSRHARCIFHNGNPASYNFIEKS